MFFHKHRRMALPIFAALFGSAFFFGCNRHACTPEGRAERVTDKISSELDLTQDQEVKLKAIVQNIQTSLPEMDAMKKDLWSELYGQVQADQINPEKLNGKLADAQQKLSAAIPKLTAGFAEFYAILTPDQKKELKEKMEKINGYLLKK